MNFIRPQTRPSPHQILAYYRLIIRQIDISSGQFQAIRRINWEKPHISEILKEHPTINTMVFSSLIYRNAARVGLLLALVFSVTSGGAQLHDVLVEPSNVLYSSTCEISDGSEHMLVASTVDDASPENL